MEQSPCKRNCCLDQDDICLGCGRSLAEITGWHQANTLQKQQILALAETRLTAKKRPADLQIPVQASRGKPS